MKPDLFNSRANRGNKTERAFQDLAYSKGWRATKRGWPDYICLTRDGHMMIVEVKPRVKNEDRMKYLRKEQSFLFQRLMAAGIRCFVSDGQSIDLYNSAIHDHPARGKQ